jgi:hypothetical protein
MPSRVPVVIASQFRGLRVALLAFGIGAGALSLAHAQTDAGPDAKTGLPAPIFSPSALPVSSQPIAVSVGVSLARSLFRPDALLLESLAKGESAEILAELRDDGQGPDAVRGDAFYSGRFEPASGEEAVLHLRLRTPKGRLASPPVGFVVTSLPLGFSTPTSSVLVESRDGEDRLVANEVLIGTAEDLTPDAVRAIVAEVGSELGLAADALAIRGSVPSLRAYSVHFEGDATLEALDRVVETFGKRRELRYATPNPVGRDNAWYIDDIGVTQMRSDAASTVFSGAVLGASSIAIAAMENGVDCSRPDFACAPNPFVAPDSCANRYSPGNETAGHGTKVLTLLGGVGGIATPFDGVDEGVAPSAPLFPFRAEPLASLAQAIDCATSLSAASGGPGVSVVNISREYSSDVGSVLGDAICQAACADMLVVVAAGNDACPADDAIDKFPARYGSDPGDCSCPAAVPRSDHVIAVGGVDDAGNHGDICSVHGMRSKQGEVFAPGWGLPVADLSTSGIPNGSFRYGTSWSAPLVAACAAVHGAVKQVQSGAGSWDAAEAELRLRTKVGGTIATPLLDCASVVFAPFDIGVVLDRSGSMNRTENVSIPGDPSATRWDALALAAEGFATLAEASAAPGSRFGVTLFSNSVLPDPIVNLQPIPGALSSGLTGALAVTPGGSTAMGAGLQQGLGELTDASRPRVLVLFTDGEQNVNPRVASDGCSFTDPASDIHTSCPGPAPDGAPRIITVGIGQPSGAYLTTLTNLAERNGGQALITSDGAQFSGDVGMVSLDDAFAQVIAPALAGSSPQAVASFRGTLGTSSSFGPFSVNRHVAQVLLRLSLSQRVETPTLLRLFSAVRIRRDGVDVTQEFKPVVSGSSASSLLLRARRGDTSAELGGTYEILVRSPTSQTALPYALRVYADDHALDLAWGVEPAAPRVGEPFAPTLRLHWRGHPIDDARVTAAILRPGDDLGDALAKHPATVDPVRGPDMGSPGTQKYLHLLASDPEFRARLAPSENGLSLVSQGAGVYRAELDPGDVSGVYQVLYRVEAEGPAFGRIERQAVQSVYTRFGTIDWSASEVSRSVKAATTTLKLRPRTRNGRLIGPAQASAFTIRSPDNELKSLTDHQDGRYTAVLVGNPAGPISIAVLGDVVYDGPLDRIASGDGTIEPEPGVPPWVWLLALLALVVLCVVLWIRSRAA